MDAAVRARLAIAIAGIAVVAGMVALVAWRVDFGVTFSRDGQWLVISTVAERSPAQLEGFQPGMVVVELNDQAFVQLPSYVYASPDVDGNVPPDPIGVEPAVPTPVVTAVLQDAVLEQTGIWRLTAISRANLDAFRPEMVNAMTYIGPDYRGIFERTLSTFLVGAAMLLAGAWLLLVGRAGPSLRELAVPLAGAVAVPLLVQPLLASWNPPAVALAGLLVPASLGLLGLELLGRVPDSPSSGLVRAAVAGCASGAAVLGVVRVWLPASNAAVDVLWLSLSAASALVPGVAAAGPTIASQGRGASSARLLQSAELAVAGATPGIALLSGNASQSLFFPLSAWLLAVLAAGRFTIRPLARLAVRAQLQRDLIVAATEAERARVAADIHDDALQELTLLVRRLDDAGDIEGADIARTVSDRLRAICGDLRLPILDDLGVGPALDWLVARIERLTGGEVRLEQADGSRLPPDIELGIFRVAQEALSNAVKHGRPPIVVRYRASASGASLSIDDAGLGIDPSAAAAAEADGHFGLLNMQQRAEQIGAILDVRRWPGGGTHVALEWRA